MVFLKSLYVNLKKVIIGLLFAVASFTDHRKISETSDIAVIVFSKDRPVQIEALLRSVLKYFSGNCSWYILWRASNDEIADAYYAIFSSFTNNKFTFIRETHFKHDLIYILRFSRHSGIIFMVDDLIFIDYFDSSILIGLQPLQQVASLRLSPCISYCQPRNCLSPPPKFNISSQGTWLEFSWTESTGDWSMPISLDGHLFSRSEILRLIKYIHFKAPNSLEASLGYFKFLFKYRKGLCLSLPAIRNFAFNRVQSENEDFPCGSWTPERMLMKWSTGWQLDIIALADYDAISCHVEVEPVFERRSFDIP